MAEAIYVDGEFVSREHAKVSVFDHGLLYGDGIFEGIRVYGGRVFRLDAHMRRLVESAKALCLTLPKPVAEISEVICACVRRSNLVDAYIRVVVTRGAGDLGLDPRSAPKASLIVIVAPLQLYPKETYRDGMHIATVATRRNSPNSLNPRIKSLNYLNNILAKIEAVGRGLPEALLLTSEGYVAEGTGDNIFFVRGDRLCTPAVHLGILAGITRDTVLQMAPELGLLCQEGVYTLQDIYTADEVFLTGTAAEIVPVVEVDGRSIGDGRPGPRTASLLKAFRERAKTDGTPAL